MPLVPGQARLRAVTSKRMQADLERLFSKMQNEVTAKVRRNAKHLEAHPNDDTVWWDGEKWERELMRVLRPHALNAAEDTAEKVASMLGRD
jgi:hypothetical protein